MQLSVGHSLCDRKGYRKKEVLGINTIALYFLQEKKR